jgi:hypothetical protein
VSPPEGFVRHHKRQTDRAISQAYVRLAASGPARRTFTELLGCVRQRSASILAAPVAGGRHPGVEALFNLARFANVHVRRPADWPGSPASFAGAAASLAQHLAGRYPVPRFLAAAWYSPDGPYSEAKRRWFVAHAAGVSFRSLDLPIRMTRRMEHIFLGSPDHLGIEAALRRAELLALGATEALIDAVLAARTGAALAHGSFWRAAWVFLAAHAEAIDLAQVGPIMDFLDAVRRERLDFSLEGQTPRSLLRRMNEWHRSLRLGSGQSSWKPSGLQPMVVEVPNPDPSAPSWRYELTELTNSEALRAEGSALRHCVGSYHGRCMNGVSRIWSLRLKRESTVRPMLTIEIDPKRNAIVQARGWGNQRPSRRQLQLLETWAHRERLRLEGI